MVSYSRHDQLSPQLPGPLLPCEQNPNSIQAAMGLTAGEESWLVQVTYGSPVYLHLNWSKRRHVISCKEGNVSQWKERGVWGEPHFGPWHLPSCFRYRHVRMWCLELQLPFCHHVVTSMRATEQKMERVEILKDIAKLPSRLRLLASTLLFWYIISVLMNWPINLVFCLIDLLLFCLPSLQNVCYSNSPQI